MLPGTDFSTSDGRVFRFGARLGEGGQAEVFAVEGEPRLLAKLYLPGRTPHDLGDRIKHLGRVFLDSEGKPKNQVPYLGLPLGVIERDGKDVGILMAKVFPYDNPMHLADLFDRPDLHSDYVYCLKLAKALCADVNFFHSSGIIVGDLSDTNILLSNGRIDPQLAWVDVDSFGARAMGQLPHVPPTGRPPSLFAPELDRDDAVPNQDSDLFSLGLLVLRILSLRFIHPYMFEEDDEDSESIEHGRLLQNEAWILAPGNYLIPAGLSNHKGIHSYPQPIRRLARLLLQVGHGTPKQRPSAAAWSAALNSLSEQSMAEMARDIGPLRSFASAAVAQEVEAPLPAEPDRGSTSEDSIASAPLFRATPAPRLQPESATPEPAKPEFTPHPEPESKIRRFMRKILR